MTENEFPNQPEPHRANPTPSVPQGNPPVQPQLGGPYYPPPSQPTERYPATPAGPANQPYAPPYFSAQPSVQGYEAQTAVGGYPPFLPQEPAGGSPAGPPGQQRSRGGLRPVIVAAAVAALVGAGVGAGTVAAFDDSSTSVNVGLKTTDAVAPNAPPVNGTIGAAAAKIRPSVVTINVAGAQASGTGSGVIIRNDGHILTNDHVVSLGSTGGKISLTFSDGRTAAAKIVGQDPSDDLSVIKVDGMPNLTAATFAKSSSLSVGQTVVAVGAPLGLSDTVTSGIISNTARPVRAGDNDQAVFQAVQTDAAINPGNSGGPLVDLNGSVVGINAAIATADSGGGLQIPGQPPPQSGNIGIGFAIPADEASRIASELIATGKASHAILGVSVGGRETTTLQPGVRLQGVAPGGVGAKAGFKSGDVVTAVNDQRVTTSDALIAAIRSYAPGEKVKITFLRDGASKTVEATLGKSAS